MSVYRNNKKSETLFEELALLVYEFVATKNTEKDLKHKEEEFLEDTVETITECNDKVALLCAKRLSLKRSWSSSGQDKGNITPNFQIDTSGLENSMLKLTTTTEKNTESLLTQLWMSNHSGSNTMDSIRLPKLEIETFEGDILKYQQFWDVFHATIDDNHKLSDVERLSYLRNIVSGAAAEAIAGLSLTHKNYSVACDLLRENLGMNKQF